MGVKWVFIYSELMGEKMLLRQLEAREEFELRELSVWFVPTIRRLPKSKAW